MSLRIRAFGATVAVASVHLCVASTAFADDCHPLTLVTSVDMVPAEHKAAEFVPVTINGASKLMLLDTGGTLSEISQEAVDALQLPTEHIGIQQYDVAGEYSDHAADMAAFGLGTFKATSMQLVIAPEKQLFGGDTQLVGILGPDILRSYDVSIDFGTDKLSLLSPDHCDGKVIYWPADTVAVVPIRVGGVANRVGQFGHIVVPVNLNGQKMDALLDTGASTSTLSRSVAESDFGLKLGSPDTPYVRDMEGRPGAAIYRHRFESLGFEGLAVNNLDVDIMPDLVTGKLDEGPETGTRIRDSNSQKVMPDLLIGMDVLRHLHIYIAYKEKKLYITPGGAPPPKTGATP